jgi:hypothetical protein
MRKTLAVSGEPLTAPSAAGGQGSVKIILLAHPLRNHQVRSFNHLYEEDNSPMQPFLHTDGETIIMNELFNEQVMGALLDNSINYLKGGPSHTSKTQDLDCGSLFCAMKAGLNSIAKFG